MKNHPPKLSVLLRKCKLRIPKGKRVSANRTEEYVKEFDSINQLKPTTYSFRGKVVNK
jgi:hypothetical protein